MADLFSQETYGADPQHPRSGQTLVTGDLRRKYNFGDRVSELAIAQDPFFRMVSKLSKKSTDDPQFKFTERRPSFHKRYAYLFGANVSTTVPAADAALLAGTTHLFFAGDYKSAGNVGNAKRTAATFNIGTAGTRPEFFMAGQLIKVPCCATAVGNAYASYAVYKVTGPAVEVAGAGSEELQRVPVTEIKAPDAYFQTYKHSEDLDNAMDSEESLSEWRSYVIGTAFGQGTGYPETWKDQPFSTGYGNTQIWKTAMAMDNTTRATVLKYDASEWARVWREKLIEHKWDIEQSLLFNGIASASGDVWYTDGIINYIATHGNQFTLPLATQTQDDFLDDMSEFLDPRYNNANATLFFVGTAVYNWLHKLSGYFMNNLEVSTNFRADMSLTGKKKVFGVDISTFSTPYGDMNVARNIHLDGTDIGILACNMKYLSYRPLVGNGLNRDTAIYVGVQTLENSGVDRRVDLIQTEAALQIEMPEAHAIWTKS